MRNQKDSHELIRQNEQIVKKSQKHDANLQKNSTLYFQIGLIVCLFAAYGLLEMKFETTIPKIVQVTPPDDPTEISIENFKVYEEPKAESKPQAIKEVVLRDKVEIVEDDFEIKKALNIVTPETKTSSEPAINEDFSGLIEKPVEPENVPFVSIQNVPIYPGCEKEKGNNARKKCMSEKITKLVQRKFDGGDIATDYGLTGRQKIDVQFTIDKTGHVTDIITRSNHPKLDKEAVRVINFIPEMTPGRQRDKNVGVIYNLPIIFQVQ